MGKKLDEAMARVAYAMAFRRLYPDCMSDYEIGVTAGLESALRMCRDVAGRGVDDPPPKGDWAARGNYKVIVW